MKKIYKERDVVPGIFGKISMVIVAIMVFAVTYQVALFFIVFGILPLLALVSYRGMEIDLEKQEYKPFLSVMGFKSGQKMKMPPIRYIVIKDTVFVSRSVKYGDSYDDNYEVALICENHVKIPLLYSYDISEILGFAVREKQTFNCHIEDLTKEQIAKNVNKA